MANRVAVHQIKIGHGKDQVIVKPGTVHDFTDKQIADLTPLGAIRTVSDHQAATLAAARAQPDEPAAQAAARTAAALPAAADKPAVFAEGEGERAPNVEDDAAAAAAAPPKAKPAPKKADDDEL